MARPQCDNPSILFENWLSELGLCAGFKIAANLLLVPEAYCAALHYKRLIKRMGVERAFRSACDALLYTGLRPEVDRTLDNSGDFLLIDPNRRNQKKAVYFADKYGYSLLERTPIGKAIDYYKRIIVKGKPEKLSVFESLEQELSKKYAPAVCDIKGFAQSQIDLVMGFVSAAYIFACKGNVDTLVCGASPQKVFYMFELPAMMANKKITSINGVSKDKFLAVYNSGRKTAAQETQEMICETEIARLGALAQKKGKASKEWEIWEEQKSLFHADTKQRQVGMCSRPSLTKKSRSPKYQPPSLPFNPRLACRAKPP